MKLLTRIVVVGLGLAFSSGALTAETAQTEASAVQINRPEVFKYGDKIVAFEITAAGHTKASYMGAPNQRIIQVVVTRGEQNDLRIDPEAPPYALDIRIADNENVVLAAQSGTGHFIDQTWAQELDRVPLVVEDEKREQDVAELMHFAEALQERVKPRLSKSKLARWAWVINELVNLLNYTEAQNEQAAVLDNDASKAPATAPATYYNAVTIKKKKAWDIVFEHSSLSYTLKKSTGSALYTIVTCNHGSCASSSTMSTHCSKTFTQSTVDAWASDLLCDFYGWPYGVHVCNNDTRAEYLSIKNRKRGSWSSCAAPRLYAPPCD